MYLILKDHLCATILWNQDLVTHTDTIRNYFAILNTNIQSTYHIELAAKGHYPTLFLAPSPTATTVASFTFPWAFSGM